ncbi:hypothetical protein [Anditalea andensis]|uniref:Outer membrane protein beta-barrel domain-containing protein n=1 Tax=Anditalea andensis TaxID=1048983 RepID=A0A074KQ66_9BACT|nr:hypothetical protein [Anditalea andensis]KEO72086.1 hypothetical protein EL17_19435 [Anditalea andensis]
MKKILLLFITVSLFAFTESRAQQGEGTFMVSGAADAIRTDIPGVIRRYQAGLEAHYFLRYWISASAGYEFNYNRPNQASLGSRIYLVDPLFVRVRGLIGRDSDIALGIGYSRNLGYRFRLEGMVDYYTVTQTAGLRGGFSILLN